MASSEADALEVFGHVLKVVHTCAGIFIWEFVTTLQFEWEVYTGRRPWRWSFIVYVMARVLGLACIILSLVGFSVTGNSIVMPGFDLCSSRRGFRQPLHRSFWY